MKFLAALAVLFFAQNIEGGGPIVTPNPLPIHSASYSGPGDVVSGAQVWWGLRAYSSAQANGSTAAVNLLRASDSHTCDILLNTSGQLGNTTNCSNGADNGTAVATWCNATTCSAAKAYDQTGNTNCTATACDVVQATAADQPTLVFSCISTLPCLQTSAPGSGQILQSANNVNAGFSSFPITIVSEAERTGSTSSYQHITGCFTPGMFFNNAPNGVMMYAGANFFTNTANDNVVHNIQAIMPATTANSFWVVDGSASGVAGAGSDPGGTSCNGEKVMATGDAAAAQTIQGNWGEGGIWGIAFNSTQYAAMSTNMANYY